MTPLCRLLALQLGILLVVAGALYVLSEPLRPRRPYPRIEPDIGRYVDPAASVADLAIPPGSVLLDPIPPEPEEISRALAAADAGETVDIEMRGTFDDTRGLGPVVLARLGNDPTIHRLIRYATDLHDQRAFPWLHRN